MNESPIRILAVDDDEGLCMLTKEILETFEYLKVDTAFSVHEAMEILARHRYDAIVSDYQMPKEDGIFFLRKLRAKGDETPFVLFTGKGREEIVIEAIDSGADAYVQKGAETRPIFTELAHKIREAVARVRAETALMESEARYRSLIDGSSVGLFLTDMNFDCVYSNRRWTEMTSQTEETSRGKGWMRRIHPEDKEQFESKWKRSIESGGTESFEYRCMGKNDRTIWIWGNAAPLKEIDGTVTGYVSTNVDITERKRAEEDLLEKERTIAKASNLAKMGHWIWKAETGIIASSDGLSTLLGIPAGEPLPHDFFFQMVYPDDRKIVIAALEKTLKGKGEFNLEHRMTRSDGSLINVRDTAEVTMAKGNRPLFILGVVQDISELKKVSKVLRETEDLHRTIFDTIAEGVVVHDPKGKIVTCNEEAARILGFPSKEMLTTRGDLDWDLVYEDGRDCPPNELPFNSTIISNAPLNNEIRGIRFRSGPIKWISINTRLMYHGASKRPIAIVVSFTDISSRKNAEIELMLSEDKFRATIDQSSDGIIMIDKDARIIEWNMAQTRIYGYTRAEMIGRPIWEYLHNAMSEEQRSTDVMRAGMMQAFNDSSVRPRVDRVFEFVLQSKDGCRKTVQMSMFPVMTSGVKMFCSISRDITAQKVTENELVLAKEQLQLAMEGSGVGLWDWNVQTGETVFNERWAAILGYSLDELSPISIGTWSKLVHPEDAKRSNELLAKHFAGETAYYECEARMRHKDGHWVWVLDRGKVSVRDDEGRPVRMSGTHLDITERKQGEEALRESVTRFRELTEMLPQTVFEMNMNGDLTFVNNHAFHMFGYVQEDLARGISALDMLAPNDRERGLRNIQEALQGKGSRPYEYLALRKDGSTFSILINSTVVIDKGRPVGLRGIIVDITEQKRAEEALKQANKKLNLLSGVTRHDINNQLLALAGNLTLLDRKQIDHSSEEHLHKAMKAAERISSTIQFTKEYEDIGVLSPIWHEVRKLVEVGAKDMAPGRIKLINDVPSGVEVFADPLILKVFYNLIDNSVRHGGKVSTIRFYIDELEGAQVIVCEDDGVGISGDIKEKLFTRGTGNEHGFGLFLSKEILAITGISIKEIGEGGRGVKFVLTIPRGGLRKIG